MTKEEKKLIGEVLPKINAAKWELNARSRVKILTEAAEALDKLAKETAEVEEGLYTTEKPEKPKKTTRPKKKTIEVPKDPRMKEK